MQCYIVHALLNRPYLHLVMSINTDYICYFIFSTVMSDSIVQKKILLGRRRSSLNVLVILDLGMDK